MDSSNAEKATSLEELRMTPAERIMFTAGRASRDAEVAALTGVIDSSARTYEELESEHTAALAALAESRARFADSEARRAELEAVIQRAREAAQPAANGEPLRERVIEALEAAPSVVLEDRDREVAARTLEEAADHYHADLSLGPEWRPVGWANRLRQRAAAIRKGAPHV